MDIEADPRELSPPRSHGQNHSASDPRGGRKSQPTKLKTHSNSESNENYAFKRAHYVKISNRLRHRELLSHEEPRLRCLFAEHGCYLSERGGKSSRISDARGYVKHLQWHGFGRELGIPLPNKPSETPSRTIGYVYPTNISCKCGAWFPDRDSDVEDMDGCLFSMSADAFHSFMGHLFECDIAQNVLEKNEAPWQDEFFVLMEQLGFFFVERRDGRVQRRMVLEARPGRKLKHTLRGKQRLIANIVSYLNLYFNMYL